MNALRDAGLDFTRHASELPGCPDIVLVREQIAIFVDGDFWHGRHWRRRRSKLAAGHNPEYWIAKIERNMQRDREQARQLTQLGWLVVRVWEGQIAKDLRGAVARIRRAVRARREGSSRGSVGAVAALPPISQFQEPVLQALRELGGSGSNADIASRVADLMALDSEQRAVRHGQDGRTEIEYRVAWARTRLSKSGKIERCGPSTWRLVDNSSSGARE